VLPAASKARRTDARARVSAPERMNIAHTCRRAANEIWGATAPHRGLQACLD
jgi:hypothetical protein